MSKTPFSQCLGKDEFDFCIAVFEGATVLEAYRKNFKICPSTDEITIKNRAKSLMQQKRIKAKLAELRAPIVQRAEMKAEEILGIWADIARACPADIVQMWRVCCRYCYGINHQYQWVEVDYALECAECLGAKHPLPDASGGFGFDGKRRPHPDCPNCFGIGLEHLFVKDTRDMTRGEKLLFDGIKKSNQGVEIKFLSRMQALEKLAMALGMFKDKLQTPLGAGLASVLALPKLSEIVTDPRQAAKVYQEIMTGN